METGVESRSNKIVGVETAEREIHLSMVSTDTETNVGLLMVSKQTVGIDISSWRIIGL